MTLRVLHFADIHVGMENYGKVDPGTGISSRVMDFLRRMTEIVEFAEQNDADLAIFAGDAFKTRSPNPTYQREFARRIKRLAQQCPVVLLVGNHDIPAMTGKASSIEIFHTLEVDNVIVGREPMLHLIETKNGPIQVATIPYPIRQRLLADANTRGVTIDELDRMLRQQVDLIIRDLASEVNPDVPAILTGHFSVQGAKYGSERGVMLGRDVSVMISTLTDPAWDYVALGHIHFHQDLNNGHYPPVVYSGSIERIDFGEESDPKGFCWVELDRGQANYDYIEVDARPFITIDVDTRGHDDPMQTIMSKIDKTDVMDAVVRVQVKASQENEDQIRDKEIADALDGSAFIAGIQREVEYPIRSRLGVDRIEGLTPTELLQHYLNTNDISEDRKRELLEYAEILFTEE